MSEPRTRAGRALLIERLYDILAIEAQAATLDVDALVDIIEQAIFETGTGLEAAMLASERIAAAYSEASDE